MTSSRRASAAAAVLGALAVLANPGAVLALTALAANRRARFARARSVYSGNGRWGARLAWAGLYAEVIGVVALGVYGALRASG